MLRRKSSAVLLKASSEDLFFCWEWNAAEMSVLSN
ncbi:unnamed protein product [Brassica rapa subsp. trilocularis]